MSGGFFNYNQNVLERMAKEIDNLIEHNTSNELGIWDEPLGYNFPEDILEKFKETSYNLKRTMEMVQRVDWLLSCDDGEDSFRTRWDKEVRQEYITQKNKGESND